MEDLAVRSTDIDIRVQLDGEALGDVAAANDAADRAEAAADEAAAIADQVLGALAGLGRLIYSTRTEAVGDIATSVANWIVTLGYDQVGDVGRTSTYKKMASPPANDTLKRYIKQQLTSGEFVYYDLHDNNVRPSQFGFTGAGGATDQNAVQEMLDYCEDMPHIRPVWADQKVDASAFCPDDDTQDVRPWLARFLAHPYMAKKRHVIFKKHRRWLFPTYYDNDPAYNIGIANAQTRPSAGNLTLNGNLAVAGVIDMSAWPRRMSISSQGANSGVTWTVTGELYGVAQTETMKGTDGTVGTPTISWGRLKWSKITQIASSGAVAGNVSSTSFGRGFIDLLGDGDYTLEWEDGAEFDISGLAVSGSITLISAVGAYGPDEIGIFLTSGEIRQGSDTFTVSTGSGALFQKGDRWVAYATQMLDKISGDALQIRTHGDFVLGNATVNNIADTSKVKVNDAVIGGGSIDGLRVASIVDANTITVTPAVNVLNTETYYPITIIPGGGAFTLQDAQGTPFCAIAEENIVKDVDGDIIYWERAFDHNYCKGVMPRLRKVLGSVNLKLINPRAIGRGVPAPGQWHDQFCHSALGKLEVEGGTIRNFGGRAFRVNSSYGGYCRNAKGHNPEVSAGIAAEGDFICLGDATRDFKVSDCTVNHGFQVFAFAGGGAWYGVTINSGVDSCVSHGGGSLCSTHNMNWHGYTRKSKCYDATVAALDLRGPFWEVDTCELYRSPATFITLRTGSLHINVHDCYVEQVLKVINLDDTVEVDMDYIHGYWHFHDNEFGVNGDVSGVGMNLTWTTPRGGIIEPIPGVVVVNNEFDMNDTAQVPIIMNGHFERPRVNGNRMRRGRGAPLDMDDGGIGTGMGHISPEIVGNIFGADFTIGTIGNSTGYPLVQDNFSFSDVFPNLSLNSGGALSLPIRNFNHIISNTGTSDDWNWLQLAASGIVKTFVNASGHTITAKHNVGGAPAGYGPLILTTGADTLLGCYSFISLGVAGWRQLAG